jgi:7-keto-8-aminopelargonate synthetase-like enzyme
MRRVEWPLAPVATFASGSASDITSLQERLMAEGIYVLYSTYVGAGSSEVIRCAVFADHTEDHIAQLHDALRRLL